MADLALVPHCCPAQDFLILSRTMSVSLSNWQRDIQSIPWRAGSKTYKAFFGETTNISLTPLPCPRMLDEEGEQFSECVAASQLLLESLVAAFSSSSKSSLFQCEVAQVLCAVCFPLSCKASSHFISAPQLPLHEHQLIDH